MPRLTSLPLEAARELGQSYRLDVVAVTALDMGSRNSNFMLTTRENEVFVVDVHETENLAEASATLELTEWLIDQGMPTVRTHRLPSGALAASFQGKPVSIYPNPPGQMSCQVAVTPERCREVGAALARLHCVPASTRPLTSKLDLADLRARLDVLEQRAADERMDLIFPVSKLVLALRQFEPLRPAQLPEGIIHGELTRSSVLWQDARISALIGFDSAGRGRFAYDLMVTVLAWCYRESFDEDLLRALLAGYQSVRPLTPAEVAALTVEGSIAALRFACTRLSDFTMRVPLGVRPARDYERYLQRLRELQTGVVERCL
jgi:homoserine kinase type II